jgi:YHS domain-containing protein
MEFDEFQSKIGEHIGQRKIEEEKKSSEIEESMRQLEEKRNAFKRRIRGFLFTGVRDRLNELGQNFDNIQIHSSDDHCTAEFSHTIEYPCTATLNFSISPARELEGFIVRYDLLLVPIFFDYKKHDEEEFPFIESGESRALEWVETRIFEFLDAYLEVRRHPSYQQGYMVTDPVCGMRFPAASAADSIKVDDRKSIYFCSRTCRAAYERCEKG